MIRGCCCLSCIGLASSYSSTWGPLCLSWSELEQKLTGPAGTRLYSSPGSTQKKPTRILLNTRLWVLLKSKTGFWKILLKGLGKVRKTVCIVRGRTQRRSGQSKTGQSKSKSSTTQLNRRLKPAPTSAKVRGEASTPGEKPRR